MAVVQSRYEVLVGSRYQLDQVQVLEVAEVDLEQAEGRPLVDPSQHMRLDRRSSIVGQSVLLRRRLLLDWRNQTHLHLQQLILSVVANDRLLRQQSGGCRFVSRRMILHVVCPSRKCNVMSWMRLRQHAKVLQRAVAAARRIGRHVVGSDRVLYHAAEDTRYADHHTARNGGQASDGGAVLLDNRRGGGQEEVRGCGSD